MPPPRAKNASAAGKQSVESALEFLLTGKDALSELKAVTQKLVLPKGPELDGYTRVFKIIGEYASQPRGARPLCFTVFGPPGTGKSTLVKEIPKVEGVRCTLAAVVNLTQVKDRFALAEAIAASNRRLREDAVKKAEKAKAKGDKVEDPPIDLTTRTPDMDDAVARVPIIFFDEFDASLDGEPLGWLQVCLEPMQDGFLELKSGRLLLDKSIFFFAGGTAESLGSFMDRSRTDPERHRARKVPDFEGRLMGSIDLEGVNTLGDDRPMRRAIQLRWILKARSETLADGDARRIEDGLAKSFLSAAHYRFGTRSIEAILSMSVLEGRTELTRDALPGPDSDLMKLHATRGPLDGKLIGVSAGLTKYESESFVVLCKDLFRLGANIAYGGPYRPENTLDKMIQAAKEAAIPLVGEGSRRVVNYLQYPTSLNADIIKAKQDHSGDVEFIDLESITEDEKVKWKLPEGYFPSTENSDKADTGFHRLAWAVSLFRARVRQMRDVHAVVAFGGKVEKYWGRYPGIAEELMIAIALGKPVYVIGGDGRVAQGDPRATEDIGKAAQDVGLQLGLGDVEPGLCGFFAREPSDTDRKFADQCRQHEELFQAAGVALPSDETHLAEFFRAHGLYSDLWQWNGLDKEENRELFALGMGVRKAASEEEEASRKGRITRLIRKGMLRLDWK